MEKEFQAEKEISIIEILKALVSKIVYLILALVVGAIAGGFYGYFTKVDYKIYGTTLQFYVNPENSETVNTESIYATYGSYSSNVMGNMISLLESEMFSAMVVDQMIENGKAGDLTAEDKIYKYDQSGKFTGVLNNPNGLTKEQKDWIHIVSNAVAYKVDSEGNIANSQINVTISVDGTADNAAGIQLATDISNQIQESVPEFVINNMPKPPNYDSTKCRLIKLDNTIGQTNTGDAGTGLLTFALIGGLGAMLVAAIVVIALHMSDKRLRDIDMLPKAFNLPVLGVIPSIDVQEIAKINDGKGGNA